MGNVLFVTWDGGGNLPPALGIAHELAGRGDHVRFLGHEQQRQAVESAGFMFTAYAHARPWSSTAPVGNLRGALRYFAMFTDHGPGRDLVQLLESEGADVLVVDCMSLGALGAARKLAVPRAVLVHTFYRYLTKAWDRGPIGLLGRLKGLNPARLWAGADLILIAADPILDPAGAGQLPSNARHVGVVQPAPNLVPANSTGAEPPRVLVSFSTIRYPGQEQALQSVLDALGQLPADGLVTYGDAVDPSRLRPPANVEMHRHLPHGEVMPGVQVVIGHGGHATTMRALAHNVPLLVMPMHPMLDQKMVGTSVAAQAAGEVLPKDASPEQIRAAVERLLAPGPHRDAAARTGARLRAQHAAAAAADELHSLTAKVGETT